MSTMTTTPITLNATPTPAPTTTTMKMLLFVSMRKWLASMVVLALLIPLGSHIYRRGMAAGATLNQGRPFYVLDSGASASFVTQGATDIHLLSYYVFDKNPQEKTSYALELLFLSESGRVYDQRSVRLPIATDDGATTMPDGATMAQLRLLPLSVPLGATMLQVKSPEGRVLLCANQLVSNRGTQEAVLERSGRPLSWFASDELQGLGANAWASLPALYNLPSIKLPFLPQLEEPTDAFGPTNRAAALRIEPHRALVLNVAGPGTMNITLESDDDAVGRFALEHYGPRGTGNFVIERGHATVELPAGPSSVILRPQNAIGAAVKVQTHKLHALGRTDEMMEASGRLGSAWRLDEQKPLRFGFGDQNGKPGPVRLTARALDVAAAGALTWRLLDENDRELRTGTLPLSNTYDPFTAIMVKGVPADIGAETKIFVTPSPQTATIEVQAAGALVDVEMLLEESADAQPLPPYDDDLGTTVRWRDVPVRGPRFVMLRPLALQSERRDLYAALLRVPRIEPIGPLPQGPWMTVDPTDAKKTAQILETPEHLSATQDIETLIPTGEDSALMLDADGKHARRITLTCEIPGQLGGELTLRIDGKPRAKAAILTSNVRLDANTSSGMHSVRVDGVSNGRCVIAARPATGAVTVRRSVYLIHSHQGLTVSLKPHKKGPLRLHYAIYSEGADSNKEVPFAVTIDNGSPGRRIGSSSTFTIARQNQSLRFVPGHFALANLTTDRAPRAVAVSAVQLGEDLPATHHRIKLQPLTSGRYWARFWIEGRRHNDTAQSFITTDATEQSEVEE